MHPTPSSKPSAPALINTAAPDPLDGAVLKLAAQAAFLQAFAENVFDEERPVDELVAPKGESDHDFGWRAGLRW